MTTTFYSRKEWGAKRLPRLGYVVKKYQFRGLVIHHTVSVVKDWDSDGFVRGDLDDVFRFMRELQTIRPDLGLDVPYSWVVFPGETDDDAIVCEGRGETRTGAHTKGFNSTRWGVAVAGNTSDDPVTEGILEAFRDIGGKLNATDLRPTIGHRDTKSTECPGSSMYAALEFVQPESFTGREASIEPNPFGGLLSQGEDEMIVHDPKAKKVYTIHGKSLRISGEKAGQVIPVYPDFRFVVEDLVAGGDLVDVTNAAKS